MQSAKASSLRGGSTVEILISWLVLSAIAYGMYVVAYVFESRTPSLSKFDEYHVPVQRNQSKAFLPGNFGLAAFIAAASPKLPTSPHVVYAAVALSIIASLFVRYIVDFPSDYKKGARNSPSKRYRDYLITSVYTFTAVTWWWPIIALLEHIDFWQIALAAVGLLTWLGCLVWNDKVKQVPNQYQYPAESKPCWR